MRIFASIKSLVKVETTKINTAINPIFEPFWFNSQEYADHQSDILNYTFLHHEATKQVFIRLYRKGEDLISPWRAPFGGPELSSEVTIQYLFDFIKEILEQVKSKGIKKISIVAPPECYDIAKADLLDEVLLHAGFSVSVTELNYHLDTDMGDFEKFVHDSEKRKLNKCFQAGFEFSIEKNPDYKKIHQLISDCRSRKGHPLSMNLEDFEKMFRDFPQQYIPFVVKDKEVTIAAAVGVKVRSDILYNFLPADHPDYLSYSPMVLLNKGMYDYCRQNSFRLYDLGIATSGGIRNEGLIKFKEHIGGKLSHKYSYEINIR